MDFALTIVIRFLKAKLKSSNTMKYARIKLDLREMYGLCIFMVSEFEVDDRSRIFITFEEDNLIL